MIGAAGEMKWTRRLAIDGDDNDEFCDEDELVSTAECAIVPIVENSMLSSTLR